MGFNAACAHSEHAIEFGEYFFALRGPQKYIVIRLQATVAADSDMGLIGAEAHEWQWG